MNIEQENAFKLIKSLILETPVLHFYDVSKHLIIQCDACNKGVGCTLMQKYQPVELASGTITEAKKVYARLKQNV